MKTKLYTSRTWFVAGLVLIVMLGLAGANPGRSYSAVTLSFSVREADAQGTTHYAPNYAPPHLDAEYIGTPPVVNPGDTYARDEVILHFRAGVTTLQRNAFMAANGLAFGRRIYGADPSIIVAKVTPGLALVVANALRGNALLEGVSVNPIMHLFSDPYNPNDPLAPDQEHLGTDTLQQINARAGWGYGHGLGQVSLIAIVDTGIYPLHEDIAPKYNPANWQDFCVGDDPPTADANHGTHVAGMAVAVTDNGKGIAGTGFTAWPMSLKACTTIPLTTVITAFNWASDHGASVINLSMGCWRNSQTGCAPTDEPINALKKAVDRAYARGITVVVAAGNSPELGVPSYPAAFGQIAEDPWPYNPALVTAVTGSVNGWHASDTAYGTWVDVSAPSREDRGQPLLTTGYIPEGEPPYSHTFSLTSAAAPQVAGLASLLTTLGYSSSDVWSYITQGATDLTSTACQPPDPSQCVGYDQYTGWGRINMGQSMALAARPSGSPGMTVVPNEGRLGVQWFNFQGSGFLANTGLQICWTSPTQISTCNSFQHADPLGVGGLGIQVNADMTGASGVWTVSMCDTSNPPHCAPTKTFTVVP